MLHEKYGGDALCTDFIVVLCANLLPNASNNNNNKNFIYMRTFYTSFKQNKTI